VVDRAWPSYAFSPTNQMSWRSRGAGRRRPERCLSQATKVSFASWSPAAPARQIRWIERGEDFRPVVKRLVEVLPRPGGVPQLRDRRPKARVRVA
jgi:hypothetical protein